MILFVFEGAKRENAIFNTLKQIFFKKTQTFVYSYCSNIYSLYQEMQELDVFDNSSDIVTLLKQRDSANTKLQEFNSADFSEIYLFFDYDAIKNDLYDCNLKIRDLLNYFCNETDKGKLYISYPMVESIRYFKSPIPDTDYYKYTVPATIGHKFKYHVSEISYYKSLDFICFKIKKYADLNQDNFDCIGRAPSEEELKLLKETWLKVINQNVFKANYICCESNSRPLNKEDISQKTIFESQLTKYISVSEEISILNSFPLFIFEYLKEI